MGSLWEVFEAHRQIRSKKTTSQHLDMSWCCEVISITHAFVYKVYEPHRQIRTRSIDMHSQQQLLQQLSTSRNDIAPNNITSLMNSSCSTRSAILKYHVTTFKVIKCQNRTTILQQSRNNAMMFVSCLRGLCQICLCIANEKSMRLIEALWSSFHKDKSDKENSDKDKSDKDKSDKDKYKSVLMEFQHKPLYIGISLYSLASLGHTPFHKNPYSQPLTVQQNITK